MEWIAGIIALVGVLRLLTKLERRIDALKANAETNNAMISRLQKQVSDLESQSG